MDEAEVEPEEHRQMDAVLDMLMSSAKRLVGKYGEFIPIAGHLTPPDEPTLVMADIGEEHPDATELIDELELVLRQVAAEGARVVGLAAVVVVTHPDTGQQTDAIRVYLEHADGEAGYLITPYAKKRFRKAAYGETFALEAEAHVFPKSG